MRFMNREDATRLLTERLAPLTTNARAAAREQLDPALERFEENMRQAQRAAMDARDAAEDFVAGAARQVRRHPLTAVSAAAGGGVLAGCLLGFALGRSARR